MSRKRSRSREWLWPWSEPRGNKLKRKRHSRVSVIGFGLLMPECVFVVVDCGSAFLYVEKKNKRIEELSNKFFTKMLTGKPF